MNARYKRGWFGESHRHYLAAKGVTTKRYLACPPNIKIASSDDFLGYKQSQLAKMKAAAVDAHTREAIAEAIAMQKEENRLAREKMRDKLEDNDAVEDPIIASMSKIDLGSKMMEAIMEGDEETAQMYQDALDRRERVNKIKMLAKRGYLSAKDSPSDEELTRLYAGMALATLKRMPEERQEYWRRVMMKDMVENNRSEPDVEIYMDIMKEEVGMSDMN